MKRKIFREISRHIGMALIFVIMATIFSGLAASASNQQSPNYAPVQSAIKEAIANGNFSLADIEGNPEYKVEILEKNDTHIKLVSTTKITFKNPKGAGFGNSKVVSMVSSFASNKWPSFQLPIVNGNSVVTSNGGGTVVDYDQQIKNAILAKIDNISNVTEREQKLKEWNNNGYESGSRTFEFKETYEATYPSSVRSTVTSAGLLTSSSNILMGFTQPIYWQYTREDNLYILGVWAAWTKLDAVTDAAIGLRLPIVASIQMPSPMARGLSYNPGTYIVGQDWSASQYSAANVPPENGNEFVARAKFDLSIQANIIVVGNIGPFYLINKGVDYGRSFSTPMGPYEKFPLPELLLSPDTTGLKISYGNFLASLWVGIGLMINPVLGSDKIDATWVATGDSLGNGQIEYHSPGTIYNFGPVQAGNYDPNTDYATVKLSDYNYYFTVCKLDLSANVQGGLSTIIGSLAIGTPYVYIYSHDCGGATGEFHLGTHQGTSANSLIVNSFVNTPLPVSSITVASPNGGENWPADSTRTISWASSGIVGNVKIELLKSGVPVKVIVPNTQNNGYYNWVIPATQIPGTDYRVRITSINNPSYVGVSTNNFAVAAPKILCSGCILYNGQTLTSQSGLYKFTMQPDGNLVLYNPSNKAVWASGTTGINLYAIMQQDGNFVIYDQAHKPKWASNTNKPGSWLIVQNDGNVVIYTTNYNAVWATNTMGK